MTTCIVVICRLISQQWVFRVYDYMLLASCAFLEKDDTILLQQPYFSPGLEGQTVSRCFITSIGFLKSIGTLPELPGEGQRRAGPTHVARLSSVILFRSLKEVTSFRWSSTIVSVAYKWVKQMDYCTLLHPERFLTNFPSSVSYRKGWNSQNFCGRLFKTRNLMKITDSNVQ